MLKIIQKRIGSQRILNSAITKSFSTVNKIEIFIDDVAHKVIS